MQPTDRARFATLMLALAEYHQRDMSVALIELYWRGLAHFDIEAVDRAVMAHVQNPDSGQFMPKVGELVRMIEGTTGDRAAIAWAKVHRAVTHVGPYQTLVFDDPLIHAVLTDMGGFGLLCNVQTDEMPFRAREFEQRYRGYAARRELPAYLSKLVGEVEAHNRSEGHAGHIPDPVLIGDPEKAAAVMAGGQKSITTVRTAALAAPLKEIAHAARAARA